MKVKGVELLYIIPHFPFMLKELYANSQTFLSNKVLREQYGRI